MLFLLLACSDKEPAVDDTSASTDDTSASADDTSTDDTDDDTGGGQLNDNLDAPVISTCDAFCYLHQTGDQYYNWRVECSATDPQGLENIWNGEVIVAQGQNEVRTDLVACDATGFCSATFDEPSTGVMCAQATSYDFIVKVQDWDQNWSKPVKVTGRQQ